MSTFQDFNIKKQLLRAIDDLGFEQPTPIQAEAYNVIRSGKNVVGIAQTGTGKTMAFMLPIVNELKFSDQINPRVAVLVPTRELVLQMVENIESYAKYVTLRVTGVYGGTNMKTQGAKVLEGCDIIVGTPGRFYDLIMAGVLITKNIKQVVIDEVDVMLDLGFRFQLTSILELLPDKRQNLMFSATMTEDVDQLIDGYFITPHKISIAVSGTPLDNISQVAYPVRNFYTKANLLAHLLSDKDEFTKVLVFMPSKKNADRLFNVLEEQYGDEMSIIHSNKSQNYRIRSITQFDEGVNRILVTTDVMARGLDLDKITHVINFDVPIYPENYMHRIGRTGRAEYEGKSILFYTEKEIPAKEAIESLMNYEIPLLDFPEEVPVNMQLIPEERPVHREKNHNRNKGDDISGPAFHEKKAKNRKTNLGGKYRRELAKKYKKPKTRGDKIRNKNKKKGK